MRIDILYGTRPELIKLAILIKKLKAEYGSNVRVISTGQHKEMLVGLEEWFGISPDITLDIMKENQNLGNLSGELLIEVTKFFQVDPPEWVIVQGDTQSAFVGAQAAFYQGIKIAHVEAGLRTYNKLAPFPEEINRQFVSKLADLHFCPSVISRRNLLDEKVAAKDIDVVGNTVIDALNYSRDLVEKKGIYPDLLSFLFQGEKRNSRMVLVTSHRRENLNGGLENICKAVVHLEKFNPEVEFLFLLHHNPKVKETVLQLENQLSNLTLVPPMTYPEFLSIMGRCYFLMTDSGGLQEEAPSFHKPVLLLRELTERPEGLEAGCVKLVGTDPQEIIGMAQELLDSNLAYKAMVVDRNPFGNGMSSNLILTRIKQEQGEVD